MYPTLVVALVNSHHTFDQMYFNPSLPTIPLNASNNHVNITGPMEFVVPNASSTGTFAEQVETKGNF
jgi:hypothetical protein